MAHIYGHTWPIRWGKPGEERIVKVYSNCDRAELFLNGKSIGTKQRDSQDFPAAGLRWNVAFQSGQNHLRVTAHKGDVIVTDEISLTYQTEPWGPPAELRITEAARKGNTVTIEATLHDAKGVRCLDSRTSVRFSLAGAGKLIDNLGTTQGSRVLQLYNGRAETSFISSGGCTIGVTAEGLPAGFLNLS
jgi:beta-galactosidase